MCGICGFCGHDDSKLLRDMTSILVHRGPDDSGTFVDRNICLGHRRLSILDLSKKGHQPMCNKDNSVFIVYNGEVYNFKEIRAELDKKGSRFNSNTDTEVILAAYEEWGEECVQKFNGMFAFAIWDSKEKKLFLARDRVGIKPLYYTMVEGSFVFASEIKSILLFPGVKREVNTDAMVQYLALRYFPGAETLFKGVNKLLPGNTLTYKDGKVEIKQYWSLPPENFSNASEEDLVKILKSKLELSVKRRMISDVPVGAYLSGGLDSATIVGMASAHSEEPLNTYTVGFDYGEGVDELGGARVVSEHFGTNHHEIVFKDKVFDVFPKLVWHLDLPHGDPVMLPYYMLSKLASKTAKVVLSGDGGDELFGGYVQHKAMLAAQKYKLIPSVMRKIMVKPLPISFLDRFFEYPSSVGQRGKEKLVEFMSLIGKQPESYLSFISVMSRKDRNDLLLDRKISENGYSKLLAIVNKEMGRGETLLGKMTAYDFKQWLPNYILFLNDKMTMANSIEGRVPLLDHEIVEFSATVPNNLKIKNGQNKYLLRMAAKEILPKQVFNVKKQPFFMPVDNWFNAELKDVMIQMFSEENVRKRGYFKYEYIDNLIKNYNKSKLVCGKQLITLMNLELWHRIYMDSDKVPVKPEFNVAKLVG